MVEKAALGLFAEGIIKPSDLEPGKGKDKLLDQLHGQEPSIHDRPNHFKSRSKGSKNGYPKLSLKSQLMVLEYIGGWNHNFANRTKKEHRTGR